MSKKDKKYIRIKEKRVFWFKVSKTGNTIKKIRKTKELKRGEKK